MMYTVRVIVDNAQIAEIKCETKREADAIQTSLYKLAVDNFEECLLETEFCQ